MIKFHTLDNLKDLEGDFASDQTSIYLSDYIEHIYGISLIPFDDGTYVTNMSDDDVCFQIIEDINLRGARFKRLLLADDIKLESLKRRYFENLESLQSKKSEISPEMLQFIEVIRRGVVINASDIYIRAVKQPAEQIDMTSIQYLVNDEILLDNEYQLADWAEGDKMLTAFFNNYSESTGTGDFNVQSEQSASATVVVKNSNGQDERVRVRAEKAPTNRDQFEMICVLRLISTKIKTFDDLETDKHIVDIWKKHINGDKGLIITTGPTGSGKSTFMLAGIQMFPKNKSLQTVENPVEFELSALEYPNIIQNSLLKHQNPEDVIRRLLRMRPHGMFVGEMSNKLTAQLAIDFGKTGHLCLGTLHANNATSVPSRLLSMGIDMQDLLAPGTLRLFIAQRLYQLICNCSTELSDEESEKLNKTIGAKKKFRFRKKSEVGCKHCVGGVIGVKAYIEAVEVGEDDMAFIAQNKPNEWKEKLKKDGVVFIEDQVRLDLEKGLLCGVTMAGKMQAERQAESDILNPVIKTDSQVI